jgi:hypothetical protein
MWEWDKVRLWLESFHKLLEPTKAICISIRAVHEKIKNLKNKFCGLKNSHLSNVSEEAVIYSSGKNIDNVEAIKKCLPSSGADPVPPQECLCQHARK